MKPAKPVLDADLIRMLEMAIVRAGSARRWAMENGFSSSFISDVLSGTRKISDRLALRLGFRRIRAWEEIHAAK